MKRAFTLLAATLFGIAAFAYEPAIRDIDINVFLAKDGTATVKEVWDVTAAGFTEWYLVRSNLGDIVIDNLRVSDENGREFVNEGEWDVDRSISAKAGRCGIVHKRDGVELCWGVGSDGPHVYTVSYTMTNAVKSLRDYDILHLQLVSPGLSSRPEHVRAAIHSNNDDFTSDNTRFWGFGFNGNSSLEDGGVVFESTETFSRNSSLIALLRFEKGLFSPTSLQDKDFEQVLDTALEGADFGESRKESFFEKLISFLFAIFPLILLAVPLIYAAGNKRRILGCKPSEVQWSRDVPFDGNLEESYYTLRRLGENKKGNTYASALILRMIYSGAITVNRNADDKVDLYFNDDKAGSLQGSARELYDMMKKASGSDRILQDKEFSRWSRKNYSEVNDWLSGVSSEAGRGMRSHGWLKNSRYTEDGQKQARGLLGFKKFLSDFTLMNERQSRDVGLWQDYLVYGSLFGIADKVAKELKDIDPQFFEEATTAVGGYDNLSRVLYQNSVLSNAITNAQVRASEALSRGGNWGGFGGGTSFGGGGGFSGGGFGGGGR